MDNGCGTVGQIGAVHCDRYIGSEHSMRAEVDLAKTRDACAVIWLRPSRCRSDVDPGPAARVVYYEKSWLASLPRLFFGLALGSITVTVAVLGTRGASILVDNGHWTMTPITIATISSPTVVLAVLLLFGPLFFRQSLSRNSARLLRRTIRCAATMSSHH
jgi:hypothetical protein